MKSDFSPTSSRSSSSLSPEGGGAPGCARLLGAGGACACGGCGGGGAIAALVAAGAWCSDGRDGRWSTPRPWEQLERHAASPGIVVGGCARGSAGAAEGPAEGAGVCAGMAEWPAGGCPADTGGAATSPAAPMPIDAAGPGGLRGGRASFGGGGFASGSGGIGSKRRRSSWAERPESAQTIGSVLRKPSVIWRRLRPAAAASAPTIGAAPSG